MTAKPDKTLRIHGCHVGSVDEGIVQPVAKAMELAVPPPPPTEAVPGACGREHFCSICVKTVVGAGRITNKARARSCHSPSYAYTLLSRQALLLLGQISRYLRTYKAQRALSCPDLGKYC